MKLASYEQHRWTKRERQAIEEVALLEVRPLLTHSEPWRYPTGLGHRRTAAAVRDVGHAVSNGESESVRV